MSISLDDVLQVDKASDQQGKGSNAWDCGPIIMSNIIDYIKHSSTENISFNSYSICDRSQINHEKQMIDVRNLHRSQYKQICRERLNQDRLISIGKDECQVAEIASNKLKSFPQFYQQQIVALSPSKVNILLALIDSHRQSQERIEYSIQEVVNALEYFHHTPFSLDQHKIEISFDVKAINSLLRERKSDVHRLSFVIGSDDFAKMTEEGRDFVDKSLFIKEIIETGDEVTLILRPRRWGKTINIDMLSKFFSITVDETGSLTSAYPYRKLFQRLRVGQEYPNLVAEHQGQYPVILFTFSNMQLETYQEIKSKLISAFRNLYDKYSYLYDSMKLSTHKKEKFNKILNGNITELEIGESLCFLTSLLQIHHDKPNCVAPFALQGSHGASH